MAINYGIYISADRNKKSQAFAFKDYYIHPQNLEGLKRAGNMLFFAKGNDSSFEMVNIEVWGLN